MKGFVISILLISIGAFTQIPNHFVLGSKQFANTDIFGVIKSNQNIIYVATNDGVHVYKHNRFHKLPRCKNQKGNSFFDLKEDLQGNVFCKNLKGQLFKVTTDSLSLFHEIPLAQASGHFNYFINQNNEVIIFHYDIVKIHSNGRKEVIYGAKYNPENGRKIEIYEPTELKDNSIFLSLDTDKGTRPFEFKNDSIYQEDFTNLHWIGRKGNIGNARKKFILNDEVFYTTLDGDLAALKPGLATNIDFKENARYFQLSPSKGVLINNAEGLSIIEFKNNILSKSPQLFPNTFISTAYGAADGQVYFGTFGGGVIVVPNIEAIKWKKEELLRGITLSNNDELFIGSRKGKVYTFNNGFKTLRTYQDNVDELFFVKRKVLINKYGYTNLLTSIFKDNGTVKDFYQGETGVWLAGNAGVSFLPFKGCEIPSFLEAETIGNHTRGTFRVFTNKDISLKLQSIAYSKTAKALYVSSYQGIKKIYLDGTISTIEYNKEPILVSDIEVFDEIIVYGTQSNGLLLFKNDKYLASITNKDGLLSNTVKRLRIKGENLFTLTPEGLQRINLESFEITNIGLEEGVKGASISNFALGNTALYVLENDGFYSVNFDKLNKKIEPLKFTLDSLKINGLIRPIESDGVFGYKENTLELFFDFKDEVKKDEAFYTYQLIGMENEFKRFSTKENTISYPSLIPGNYTFKMRLNYRDQQSETFTYSFIIKPPFWQRLWFYLLIIFIAGFSIFLVFQRKLKRQEKEARIINEINSSKLTAIQSQMNPHFVFNALNSIQHLVINGDTDQAYNYITRFANLVRKTLDFSEKETISVFQEIELLEVYLKLEKLRFNTNFDYEIIKSNIHDVQVPPMLIQPFIENALVHGLMHKKGLKKLNVHLEIKDNLLICKVEDNGIGREAAKLIRKRQRGNYKSFALNAINNRFRILRDYYPMEIGYVYKDFTENDDITTRVTLRIPVKYRVD